MRGGSIGIVLAILTIVFSLTAYARDNDKPDFRNAVIIFGAQMADNDWKEIATLDDVSFRDAYLAGVGVSREIAGSPYWAVELEGQVVRHFGVENHWEFNGAFIGRWRGFPWTKTLATSLAFGVGPSYATSVPSEEIARDGESARFLLYWVFELEVGLPEGRWSGIARLHHRSNAYGVLADDGGSNWITLGARWRF